MLCSDTGQMKAIRFKHLNMDLAKDIEDALDAIVSHGNGEGEIKMPVKQGKVSVIDFLFRKFRGGSLSARKGR